MLIGYIRPNEDDKECKNQIQLLADLNCDQLFIEEHSSPKKRVVLKKVMGTLQQGDTIVVAKLFSFADSTRHLAELLNQISDKQAFLLSVEEGIDTRNSTGYSFQDCVNFLLRFQSDAISENTKKGLYEAKQKGIKAGRPRKPDENVTRAISMYQSQKYSLAQIKEETGISKTTLYRYLES